MLTFSEEPICFEEGTVLWNRLVPNNSKHVKNFLCLVTKQYIYRQRCLGKSLQYQELLASIIKLRNIEKYIAMKNNRLSKHNKKWYVKS